ncbi:MAG: glycerol-3-phosphate responsive antiterminator [Firmicutes bacterium]|jgi:glycerol uptake operon antiterminator|nr:glycerol-3-phosphate responsive antiterminator [Bacillota bacterium]
MRIEKSLMPSVIPAIRDPEQWNALGDGQGRWVFLLGGRVDVVAEAVALLQRRHWHVFVHIDMVKGITGDFEGLRFFREFAAPDGIISTHSHTVNHAVKLGLMTIQRIFLIDSQSVESGIAQVEHQGADAVEVLPGILPNLIRILFSRLTRPLIAGGLITTAEQVEMALAAGAVSVSTSTRDLFALSRREG